LSGYFLHGSLLQLLLEHGDFSTDISQGSVATYLRCGRILKSEFIANLPLSANKKIENRLTFGEVMDKSCVVVFLTRGVVLHISDKYMYVFILSITAR